MSHEGNHEGREEHEGGTHRRSDGGKNETGPVPGLGHGVVRPWRPAKDGQSPKDRLLAVEKEHLPRFRLQIRANLNSTPSRGGLATTAAPRTACGELLAPTIPAYVASAPNCAENRLTDNQPIPRSAIEMAKRVRRHPVSRLAVCDIFDWTCSVDGDHLRVRLRTDLPAKTRLQLQITRPSEGYIWTDVDDRVSIQPIDESRGFEFVRSVDDLDRDGLNKYRHWKGRWPAEIEGLPEDTLIVRIVLNALEHQFGVCNRDLSGSQIEARKNGHWIERQAELKAAIPEWLPDALP
ncbi:MAG: hypothetical protein RIC55_17840 [Pirellulaceae bacterium]